MHKCLRIAFLTIKPYNLRYIHNKDMVLPQNKAFSTKTKLYNNMNLKMCNYVEFLQIWSLCKYIHSSSHIIIYLCTVYVGH